MSNQLRVALGLPPIHPGEHASPVGRIPILPLEHTMTMTRLPVPQMDGVSHFGQRSSFAHRLHAAMNSLGPWEGRAVAFVLGCGLGVLLRMFFVLTVLIFRARTRRTAAAIRLNVDEGTLIASPPEYVADEKHPLTAETSVKVEGKP
jgi:hypothetical protein